MNDRPDRFFYQQWHSMLEPEITPVEWVEIYGMLGVDADPTERIRHRIIVAAQNWRQQQKLLDAKVNLNREEEADRWAKIERHAKKICALFHDDDARFLDVWDGIGNTDQTLAVFRSALSTLEARATILKEAHAAEHDGIGKSYRHTNKLYEELLTIWVEVTGVWPTVTDKNSTTQKEHSGPCFEFVRSMLALVMHGREKRADASIAEQITNIRQAVWDSTRTSTLSGHRSLS